MKYSATITVRGWVEGTMEDADKNVSVPRCTKIIHHVFEASSKTDAEITLKWFLNHPETKYHFRYHSIKNVKLSELLTDEPLATTLESIVKDTPLIHARGIGISFNRDKLYTEESRETGAASGSYVVVSWGRNYVQIGTTASPGEAMEYRVPIDSIIITGDNALPSHSGWSSLTPNELMYMANKQSPVFLDAGVETALS